jgi:NAD-dependent deacetylase
LYPNAIPNKAHISLNKLEEMGKLSGVITQNIDGLHQSAGSKVVIELHGSLHRNYCINCGQIYSMDYVLSYDAMIPRCAKCSGVVRPDVVLYGESLDKGNICAADRLVEEADMLIIGGTSLNVYPAAGYVRKFKGNKLVIINKTSTRYDNRASLIIREPIGLVLDEVLNSILK